MPQETPAVIQEAVNMVDGTQPLPGPDTASLMEVDTQEQVHVKSRGVKRGAEEEQVTTESSKKLKPGKSRVATLSELTKIFKHQSHNR
jgi:hypothetical protein